MVNKNLTSDINSNCSGILPVSALIVVPIKPVNPGSFIKPSFFNAKYLFLFKDDCINLFLFLSKKPIPFGTGVGIKRLSFCNCGGFGGSSDPLKDPCVPSATLLLYSRSLTPLC